MPPKEKRLVHIDKVYSHCDSTKSFYLKFLDGNPISYQPGQFIIAHIPKEQGIVKRAYSIASAPFETIQTGYLEICLNRVEMGYVSNWLHDQETGIEINIDGPHGNFIVSTPPPKDLIFCATGTGIAPIRSIIVDLKYQNILQSKEIWLFFGIRYETDILYHTEFEEIFRQYSNFHYMPTISRPVHWTGETGYVQAKVQENIKNPEQWEVYACGLSNMIKDLGITLESIGFQKEQLHYDKW